VATIDVQPDVDDEYDDDDDDALASLYRSAYLSTCAEFAGPGDRSIEQLAAGTADPRFGRRLVAEHRRLLAEHVRRAAPRVTPKRRSMGTRRRRSRANRPTQRSRAPASGRPPERRPRRDGASSTVELGLPGGCA
jgi:hypothetical protein